MLMILQVIFGVWVNAEADRDESHDGREDKERQGAEGEEAAGKGSSQAARTVSPLALVELHLHLAYSFHNMSKKKIAAY